MKTFLESLKEVKNTRVAKEYKDWVIHLLKERELNFHPDEDFKDYINTETKKKTFTPEEAKKYNAKMKYFFDNLGDKVYDIGVKELKKHLFKEDLTRETVDLKKVGQKVSVKVTERGKEIYSKELARDISVKSLIFKVKQEANFKGKVDQSVVDLYDKEIGSIAFENIVEFQVNQNGVLVANPSVK